MENNELSTEEIERKKINMKKIIFIAVMLDLLIVYFAVYFFVFKKEEMPVINTQTGSIQNYSIAEILDISCNVDNDCETPIDYLIRSSCPFTSKCLEKKCNVICPEF